MEIYPGGNYSFTKSYEDKVEAVKDITNICTFLKEQMDTERDWVREMFNDSVDIFVRDLHEADITSDTYIYEGMSGNYCGTDFIFRVKPCEYSFTLSLTDEEFELIHKSIGLVTRGQIKDAVMALFKEE
jgi:hypothetical protein